ncbi:MAG: gamma-glutamyl-gamma-aminobutyrate hydrolase family protein [Candidatus Binatia bacterium]
MTSGAPPLIGVTADVSGASGASADGAKRPKDATLFLPQRYLTAIARAGAIAVVVSGPQVKSALRHMITRLNGLVLSGGHFDIHPRYYGERPIKELGEIKAARTEFELEMTAAALRRNLPVLGICGGAQAINVALGGSLYQDIATQLPGAGAHECRAQPHALDHPIRIETGTRLFKILGRQNLRVNTTHHQAVKQLGRGLIVNAVAADGVIEGIESTEHSFVLGVQWHPEVLAPRRRIHRRLFSSFVALCNQRLRAR